MSTVHIAADVSLIALCQDEDLVSVIVPAFEAQRFIRRTLESVLAQTYEHWELIIVDDGSSDETFSVISEFAALHANLAIRCLRHSENQGQAAARNTAIASARGRYIALLDADDIWLPKHLETSLTTIQDGGSQLVFSTAGTLNDVTGEVDGLWGPNASELDSFFPSLLFRNFVVPSTVVLEREVFDRIGLFNTDRNIQGCEDFDLWIRCWQHGLTFAHQPGQHCLYRKGHLEAATSRMDYISDRQARVIASQRGKLPITDATQKNALSYLTAMSGLHSLRSRPFIAMRRLSDAWFMQPFKAHYLVAALCAVGFLIVPQRLRPNPIPIVKSCLKLVGALPK